MRSIFRILVILPVLSLVSLLGLGGCTMLATGHSLGKWNGKVAIFPASVGTYEEAQGVLEGFLDELLKDKSQGNLASSRIKEILQEDPRNKEIYDNYFALLSVLHFSDAKMSKQLGNYLGCDYFIFIFVEDWTYREEDKHKYANVLLRITAVEAMSGKIMWEESRFRQRRIFWLYPTLDRVGKDLLKEILAEKHQ